MKKIKAKDMEMKVKDIDFYNLGFELIETESMFLSDYKNGKWDNGKLVPFGPIEISPAACVFNYGQGIFEGMKALERFYKILIDGLKKM